MGRGLLAAAALIGVMVCGAAQAAGLPSGGLTRSEVSAWLAGQGYVAQEKASDDGSVHLTSSYGGVNVGVYMFDCKGDRCGSLQFSSGWATHGKFDTSQMNAWNRDKRWCRGYFDSVGDPWVEHDVDLTPGGTYELLGDEFQIFRKCVDDFRAKYSL
jgi:hypothetical protein